MAEHRGHLKPFAIFIALLLSVSFVLAHSPIIPDNNERLDSATIISDPTKSWVVYGELHESMEAQYYRFNISKDQSIHLSLLKSTNPDNRDFLPDFALMGPGIQNQGDIPEYVEIPAQAGVTVLTGEQPSRATYEPFSASSFYHLAELEMNAPVSGTYYIAVYGPTKGGHYSLAVGDRETYSLFEWILIPIRLISIYQWDGQSMLMIFLPVIVVFAMGALIMVFWKKSWIPETPFEYAGVLAGLLFFGSSAMIFFEMVLALTRAPVVPEVAITIITGLFPILLGVTALLVIYKNREKVDIRKRAYFIIIGILALFLWAGFLVGPCIALLASIMPSGKSDV
ncbi:MAG: hypothetical protein JXA98_05525 [Methanosarcinaceae archaeon]|nr:hypothetical protein [Methanosarcinaceae archaeon]